MQPSARQRELEQLYEKRRGHAPHISITDDNHHVTSALASYYDDDAPQPPPANRDARPFSYMNSPSEVESAQQRSSRRNGSYFDMNRASPPRTPLAPATSNEKREKVPSPTDEGYGSVKRVGSMGSENNGSNGPGSPPGLSRQSSSDTASQHFPLNDIDYESSPAAVAQELSNLQAIRRMSMSVDTADPDLPSFGGGIVPTKAPNSVDDEDDAATLFWVPARLHPELAPKEFKTFIEDRVDKIKRRSGDADTLSVDGLERSGSGSSSLRRKKSMLSHQIDTRGTYEDGADRLERKRSKGMSVEGQTQVELAELETLVNDPAQLVRRMSLDTARSSLDSNSEVPAGQDMPILPPNSQSLKRSTRTTYRRGSLRKGERVPFSKRAQQRQTESEGEESSARPSASDDAEPPMPGLSRVQTEPTPPPTRSTRETYPSRTESSLRWKERQGSDPSEDQGSGAEQRDDRPQRSSAPAVAEEEQPPPPRPQPKQFHSRLASGPGRTTAQLPGYNNTNPLPNIIETLPDGTKVPIANVTQNVPERKSSHELPRPFHHRGGAHNRPVPGREHQRSSTLDDISSRPSPLPGSGNMGTDALTMVPTFSDQKAEKKDKEKKSSWKWILGSDDDEKERKAKEESASAKAGKGSRLTKPPGDKARLDVLQNSIEGHVPSRGRESLVLSREDLKLDEERKKEGKKASDKQKDKSEKDSGLLSAIFGGKKKSSDGDLKEKRRKAERHLSPDPAPRILKPDIDYNWTRFSILEERAIYRMAHIKLANPRRALYSQVLLSNFMYSYLAKVQMMHPHVQIPPAHQKSQQRGVKQQQQGQNGPQSQPAEYSQYQRWQEQQDRESTPKNSPPHDRTQHLDGATGGGAAQQQQQQRPLYDYGGDDQHPPDGYDTQRSSEEYAEYDHSYQQHHAQHNQQAHGRPTNNANGVNPGGGGRGTGGSGYSVAGTHDYLGYPKDQQPFDSQGLWSDEEKTEELW